MVISRSLARRAATPTVVLALLIVNIPLSAGGSRLSNWTEDRVVSEFGPRGLSNGTAASVEPLERIAPRYAGAACSCTEFIKNTADCKDAQIYQEFRGYAVAGAIPRTVCSGRATETGCETCTENCGRASAGSCRWTDLYRTYTRLNAHACARIYVLASLVAPFGWLFFFFGTLCSTTSAFPRVCSRNRISAAFASVEPRRVSLGSSRHRPVFKF